MARLLCMNNNIQIQPRGLSDLSGNMISFLPSDRIIRNIRIKRFFGKRWRRLGLHRLHRKIERKFIITHQLIDGVLCVSYKCFYGYKLFLDREKDKAEKYFGRTIKISPLIGEKITITEKQFIVRLKCVCGFNHLLFPKPLRVLGTDDQVNQPIQLTDPSWNTLCPICSNKVMVSMESR